MRTKSYGVLGCLIAISCSGSKKPTDESHITDSAQDDLTSEIDSDSLQTEASDVADTVVAETEAAPVDAGPPSLVWVLDGNLDSKWAAIPTTVLSTSDPTKSVFSSTFIGAWQISVAIDTCDLVATKMDPVAWNLSSNILDRTSIPLLAPYGSCNVTLTTRGNTIYVQGNTATTLTTYVFNFDPTTGTLTTEGPSVDTTVVVSLSENYEWYVPYQGPDSGTNTAPTSISNNAVWVDPQATIDPVSESASPTADTPPQGLYSARPPDHLYGLLNDPYAVISVCGNAVYELGDNVNLTTTTTWWSISQAADAGDAGPTYHSGPSLPAAYPTNSDFAGWAPCMNGFIYAYIPMDATGLVYGSPIQSDGSLGGWFSTYAVGTAGPLQITSLQPEYVVAENIESQIFYVGGWERKPFGNAVAVADSGASDGSTDALVGDAGDTGDAVSITATAYTQAQCTTSVGTWCPAANACLPKTSCAYFCNGHTLDGQSGVQCFPSQPQFPAILCTGGVQAACP